MNDELMASDAVVEGHKDVLNSLSASAAERLIKFDFNVGALRPWKCPSTGRAVVTIANKRHGKVVQQSFVVNANATLTKDEWIDLSTKVQEVRRQELGVFDIVARFGGTFNVPNPMGVTQLQHQTASDIGDAVISMNALKKSDRDRQEYDLTTIPFPIIHKELSFDIRQIAQSRRMGTGIDVSMTSLCTRKVLEARDKLFAGSWSPVPYFGGGYVYGLTNYTSRLTGSMSDPTAVGWIPEDFETNIATMIEALRLKNFKGPFVMLASPTWGQYLIRDYSATKGDNLLWDRILKYPQIKEIVISDYIPDKHVVVFAPSSEVVEAVNGMPPTPVQWEENGGFVTKVKIICMQIPRLRKDFNDNVGIADYSY